VIPGREWSVWVLSMNAVGGWRFGTVGVVDGFGVLGSGSLLCLAGVGGADGGGDWWVYGRWVMGE